MITAVQVATDDLDGSVTTHTPTSSPVETVEFSLDGAAWQIELGPVNAAALRAVFADYIPAARRTGGKLPKAAALRTTQRFPATAAAPSNGSAAVRARAVRNAVTATNAEIRDWAKDRGMKVSERGRIPGEIKAAFAAAH